MKAKRGYGYSSYRGRMTFQGFMKGLIAVLAIVLVLILVGYFIVQRYIVYTDEGTRVNLPFWNTEKESPAPSESMNVVVEDGKTPEDGEPTASPTVQAEELRAVWLPLTALSNGTAQEQAQAAGANAVVFDMKLTDGSLAYHSDQPLADKAKANAADGDGSRAQAIRALNDSGLYTVARISCFKDDKLYKAGRSLNIHTNSDYLWTDPDGVHWSSPANQEVRDYLSGIAGELAALGFDEILLDHAGYPTEGQLGWIKQGDAYAVGHLDGAVGQFYEQVSAAVKPYGVKLSVCTTEEAVAGTDSLSGQTAADLAAWADRIWLTAETRSREELTQLLRAAGAEDPEGMTVLLTDTLTSGMGDQAVFDRS